MRRVLLLLAVLAAFGLASCGGDDDSSSEGAAETAAEEVLSQQVTQEEEGVAQGRDDRAQGIADCAERAGFDPMIFQIPNGATAVDLTTETATIVVQLYDSDKAAAAAAKKAPLNIQSFGDILLLGGAIPKAQREQIATCIEAP